MFSQISALKPGQNMVCTVMHMKYCMTLAKCFPEMCSNFGQLTWVWLGLFCSQLRWYRRALVSINWGLGCELGGCGCPALLGAFAYGLLLPGKLFWLGMVPGLVLGFLLWLGMFPGLGLGWLKLELGLGVTVHESLSSALGSTQTSVIICLWSRVPYPRPLCNDKKHGCCQSSSFVPKPGMSP